MSHSGNNSVGHASTNRWVLSQHILWMAAGSSPPLPPDESESNNQNISPHANIIADSVSTTDFMQTF